MLKISVNGQEQWADCSPQVKGFAAKVLQEGQDVVLTAAYLNNRYNVSRIEAFGAGTQPPAQNHVNQPPATPAYTPAQHSAPQNYNSSEFMKPRTPEEAERMTRLSVLSSVCTALGAVPGQIDVNTLWDVVDAGYARFLTKVKE
jgi:hypothetical protein